MSEGRFRNGGGPHCCVRVLIIPVVGAVRRLTWTRTELRVQVAHRPTLCGARRAGRSWWRKTWRERRPVGVERVRRDVVPRGALAVGIKARRGVGLLRGSGVAAPLDGLVPGVRAAAVGVRVAGVRVPRVPVLAAGGPGTARLAGKGVGRPVGGPTSHGVVRAAGRPESGLIGRGGLPIAEKGRRGSGEGVRGERTGPGVRGPGSGRTGRGGLRMAEDRGIGRRVSGEAGTRTRAREAAGRAMGARKGLGALGRTTSVGGRRSAAPRDHDGGPRAMRAG